MSKKIQSFQRMKDLLEKSASEGAPTKEPMPSITIEEAEILKELTGVDFTETLDKIGALKKD